MDGNFISRFFLTSWPEPCPGRGDSASSVNFHHDHYSALANGEVVPVMGEGQERKDRTSGTLSGRRVDIRVDIRVDMPHMVLQPDGSGRKGKTKRT